MDKRLKKVIGDFDPFVPPPSIAPVPDGVPRPLWSVMIPTFNCANYLRQTLESVLSQAPAPDQMQIEVVDDYSTKDDPEAVVREVGKGRVAFYRKPKNEGAISNFNTCIERSRGRLVHILHGDDYILPGFYQKIEKANQEHPEVSLIATRIFFVDEEGIILNISPRLSNLECGGRKVEDFFYGTPLQFAGSVMKRDFYEREGGFDHRLVHTADWQMWMRGGVAGILVLPEVLAAYRMFSSNDTGRLMKTAENLRDRERLASWIEARFPEFSKDKMNKENLMLAESQCRRFIALNDQEAARANTAFWKSRATWKYKVRKALGKIKSLVF